MEEETTDEQILEKIQAEVKQIPALLENDSYEFQDRHAAMQTYLIFRMLQEIEGIHNGLNVLYNERQNGKNDTE
jgi:hypothetical protein